MQQVDPITNAEVPRKMLRFDLLATPKSVIPYYMFVFLSILIFISILSMNEGTFIYTLDDPYIHLAMAEGIAMGTYGINIDQYAAASSSIIWPFILAPFSQWDLLPLLMNFAFGLLTVHVIDRILRYIAPSMSWLRHTLASLFLIIICNLVVLIFNGMEHSLQVLVMSLGIYGIFREYYQGEMHWILFAAILGPLVRYEMMAYSVGVAFYLLLQKRYLIAIIATIIPTMLLGGFSAFLMQLGLEALPTSVSIKTRLSTDTSIQNLLIGNLLRATTDFPAFVVTLQTAILLVASLKLPKIRIFILPIACMGVLHILAGRYGWSGRYEMYISLPLWLMTIYVFVELARMYAISVSRLLITTLFLITFTIFSQSQLILLVETPISSNSVYRQQFQMHRFITEFYPQPVAVNDIGWVSYRNDNLILDLYGLGSIEARDLWRSNSDFSYVPDFLRTNDITFAMVYSHWFDYELAESMIPVATLEIEVMAAGIDSPIVTWFAIDESTADELRPILETFSTTLPPNVTMTILPPSTADD